MIQAATRPTRLILTALAREAPLFLLFLQEIISEGRSSAAEILDS